jgi:hypothetical protein
MNERQRAHVDYFLERIEYWRGIKRDDTLARMFAARDADDAHPLRNEEDGSEVFDYLRRLERESPRGVEPPAPTSDDTEVREGL